MERLYYEEPSIKRKEDAIDYIREFQKYNSTVNGGGGLDVYVDNYEDWLVKLENDKNRIPNEEKVPAYNYFLIRESDDRIVGIISIRPYLNEKLKRVGGNIGYSIRPTERRKGYNKINLYLGLQVLQKVGVEKAILDADLDNPASWRTMEALGGKRIDTFIDESDGMECVKYEIDVDKSLETYKSLYEMCTNATNK